MKNILLITVTLFSLDTANAQSPLEWVKQIGGPNNDMANTLALDRNGNVYSIGTFTGTADFDPNAGVFNLSSSAGEVFITKLDASGNLVWAKQLPGKIAASGALFIDLHDNVYITGYFSGTQDLDPGSGTFNLTSYGGEDIFILKLNASGNLAWVKQMGGTSNDAGASIAVDTSGNVFSTGSFKGIADFDPGASTANLISYGGSDMFISKTDSSGNFLWAKQIGDTLDNQGTSIAVDIVGNVYLSGVFEGTIDFNPDVAIYNLSSYSINTSDIFVLKLDHTGNFVWAGKMGGSNNDYAYSIAIDKFCNVITTGYFQLSSDFDPGIGTYTMTATGKADIFISKLDSAGHFMWAKNIGGAGSNFSAWANGVCVDTIGNIYTTGAYNGTTDFNPGADTYNLTAVPGGYSMGGFPPTSVIYPDIFISKLDSEGNFIWALGMGETGIDYGYSIAVDPAGKVYTAGIFNGTIDFDPDVSTFNLTDTGSDPYESDVFIHKIIQTPTIGITEHAEIKSFISVYPNPVNNSLTIETGKSTTVTIVNLLGQELFNSKIEKAETIDVSFLSDGIYFVKDLSNGRSIKFIKQ